MIPALFILPAACALASLLIRSHAARRVLLAAASAGHTTLVALCWARPDLFPALGDWLAVDAPGLLFLTAASILFLAASVYAVGFLSREARGRQADLQEGMLFDNQPETIFTACLLGFLSTMTLVTLARHSGLLWVSVEATTLVSAPLIHFHRHHRSLEATWKYLLICSVGIAIALLGTYFLSAAGAGILSFPRLAQAAPALDPRWLKAAFLLMLVGYGTKMGLVPFHTWLPDAHSEAPSPVSALLSGALLNCAFLAVLRITGVCEAAGLGDFSRGTLLVFGLASMAAAAAFIIAQRDYKRMLAYSSVEHMGILAVGVGLAGMGTWGALFHSLNHSLVKGALFMIAGNLLAAYGSKRMEDVRGALKTVPLSGALWLIGLFAITGAPPFGTFASELAILRAAMGSGSYVAAAIYLAALAAAFIGMAGAFIGMAQGRPGVRTAQTGSPAAPATRAAERAAMVAAPAALLAAAAALGIFVPGFLDRVLQEAARLLGAL
jgi:hydrogenase-4 component F